MADGRPKPIEVRRVDPDPTITSAVGQHHLLTTAIADLVDNSIDAHARTVLIRFVLREGRAAGLLVVDDGEGMDPATADDAMGYARQREYEPGDLGHFGIGMKAASLSQADTLWVWSHRYGYPPVGRGLERSSLDSGPMVQHFASTEAAQRLKAVAGHEVVNGTVVEWRDVRAFLQSPDEDEQRQWLESTIESVRSHLGLVLHRILTAGRVTITIDQWDEDFDVAGVPRRVDPLDPFGYTASGRPGYPQRLELALDGGGSTAYLHVWPHEPGAPQWQLGGRAPADTQGLYVYRHDRLLQAGGWGQLASSSRDLNPARVALDIDAALETHVRINPEKTGVVLDATLVQAWNAAERAGGCAFLDYLNDVRYAAAVARGRRRQPVTVAEPRRGFVGAVLEAFEDNSTYGDGAPVDLRWRGLMDDEVFRVDPVEHTVWLNTRYRAVLGGVSGLANDDAQVTKALLHMLVGQNGAGEFLGPKAKQDMQAWNAILLAAVQDAERRHARTPGKHASPTSVMEDDE